MDTTNKSCSTVIVANGDYPVWCSEDTLLPVFTDVSLQVAMDSQHPPASPSVPPALPELRLVLLGRKGAGKSAAGNTILEGVGGFESGKPTEECVKRRADEAGRRLTVVDTPGWEWYYPLNGTPNWVRRETLWSMLLCPPGPHALLLVVRACASVTEDYIDEIEDHLEPLGKGVWEHTMLLFTRGDELGLVSMEQRILTGGPALQRLLQKCGNRYHVVDNRSKGDGTQVKELIRKLEEMGERKTDGCSYLVMDNTVLLGLEADGKRRAREKRKKQRQMEEQMQRVTIKAALMSDGPLGSELNAHQSFSKAPRRLPEVRLVLLGERETGKSSAGNAILGKMGFFQVGAVTEECIRQQAEVAMRLVTVVDTPGWEGGVSGATPERVKREIVSSVALCPPGAHALLLTLRVDTLVMVGHVKEHLELLGDGVWRHTILLFTHGDQLREGVDIEQHIQGGGRDLQWLLEKCRGRYHVISSIDKRGRGHGGSCKVTELLQEVEKMVAMNRCETFSGLVQEVRDLSRQRNEKFNQRLKEMGDKMLRQETELRNMREREMKSIRWFFDRKKKVKSPEKANIQREEEEEEQDRRNGERKNDIGELEEGMRCLTEDKEREIQDLSIEKERICVALNQSRREQDKAMLNLEVKERENEELKERVEEQQLKLLDLERSSLENEHERKQREDALKVKEQEWMREVKKLKENIEQQKRDKGEWMERADSLKREMDEIRRQHDNILKREAREKIREMEEMEERLKTEMKIKLLEKEEAMEDLRKKASEEKQTALRKAEEMKSQHKKEIERKTHDREMEIQGMKLQHQEEMTRKICQIENMMEKMSVKEMRGKLQQKENKETDKKNMEQMLEDREREIQAIKERLHQTEGRERDNSNHNKEMEQKLEEKERLIEKLTQHVKDINETLQRKGEKKKEAEKQMQDREREMEEMKLQLLNDMERKLREKETENESLKQQANSAETKWMQEQKKKKERGEIEMNRLRGIIYKKTKEITQMQSLLSERDSENEKTKKTCANLLKEIARLKESNINQNFSILEIKQLHTEQERRKDAEMMEKLQMKDEELHQLRQRDMENEKELVQLRLVIEQTKFELKELTNKMEKEMTSMIEEYEKEIARSNEGIESIAKEKDCAVSRLEEESRQRISEVTEKYEESRRRVDVLQEQNKEVRKEADHVVEKYEELKKRSEEEVRKHLEGYEQQVKSIEAEIQSILKERDIEVRGLKEANDKLQAEIERMTEREGEAERQKKDTQLKERFKDQETEKESLKREEDLAKREQVWGGNEEELSEREHELDSKEEELVEKEVNKEHELSDCEANLENQLKRQDDKSMREQSIKKKEKELESLLLALEGKQKELNYHGQDLQKKVKGLKDQEKELRDWEDYLKKEEKELLNWKSELQMRDEQVKSTAQQLEEMGRDLALLKEELHDKKKKLKKLSRWEGNLEQREEELLKREKRCLENGFNDNMSSDLTAAVEISQDNLPLTTREAQGKEEKGKGRESDRGGNAKDREDQRMETASSAAESNNHKLKVIEMAAEGDRMRQTGGEMKKMKEREGLEKAEVSQDFKLLSASQGLRCSNNKESAGCDLRVVVLGESWSSRSPAGLTILGGEASKHDGSGFRHWRGQRGGQPLAIVEPLGLRWRHGPDTSNTMQRKGILDGISWCHPGPHVVLLLIPAFLTCTREYRRAVEEHMRLLGEEVWQRALVLFTWGEVLGESAEQHILRNGELMQLVERCGGRYHVVTSRKSSSMTEALFEKMMALNRPAMSEFVM